MFIKPILQTPYLISLFLLQTPLRVNKGELITATFWRCVNSRRIWYEWIVEVGNRTTPLHNANGRSSEMLL